MKYKVPLMQNAFFSEELTKKKLSKFIIKSKKLSMDKNCIKFEKQFAKFHKSKYAVFRLMKFCKLFFEFYTILIHA